MIFRDIEFFVIEALIGMRRSGLMIFISIATITVSLIVFGIFLLLTVNMNNMANLISDKLEIRVYLKEGVTQREIQEFMAKLNQIEGITEVGFVPKTDAWKKFQQNYKNVQIGDLIKSNPLPDSLHVKLENNRQLSDIAKYISTFTAYVEDVSYGGIIAQRIALISNLIRIGGLVLVLLLGMATLLIIVNTIRLTVIARQDEISIMQLVGATNTFIRWPFIIEGMIIGLIGSTLAIIFLKIFYVVFGGHFQEAVPFFPLVFNDQVLLVIYIFVGFVGSGLGTVGAYLSVSRTLKSG